MNKKIITILLGIIAPVAVIKGQVTQGPNNPGTIATGPCSFSYGSTLAYTPSANVVTSNNAYASVMHCACCDANTNCLTLTNFGFSVPATATIKGIRVEIEKRADFGSMVQDNGLRLLKGGVEVGLSLHSAANWPSFDTYASYGGCTNLWGTTWTPAEINASNFGLVFASIDYTCGGNIMSYIDHVRVTVCYDLTLPVELSGLNAECREEGVLLTWSTTSEINSSHFSIERKNGSGDWVDVGQVKAAGDSKQVRNYSFWDDTGNSTANPLYYRLIQADLNGGEENVGVVAVHCDKPQHEFRVYPNPGRGEFTAEGTGGMPLVIYTVLGDVVFQSSAHTGSSDSYQINLEALPAGIYMARVKNGRTNAIQKLVIR